MSYKSELLFEYLTHMSRDDVVQFTGLWNIFRYEFILDAPSEFNWEDYPESSCYVIYQSAVSKWIVKVHEFMINVRPGYLNADIIDALISFTNRRICVYHVSELVEDFMKLSKDGLDIDDF